MTNEQLCVLIQQGGKELIPILWERVKRLCFMLCGQYYSKYRERFAACGVELCDLRQECYAAFLAAVRSYKADGGAQFASYLGYPIRKAAAELLGIHNADRVNRRPLDNAVSLDKPIEAADNDNMTLEDVIPDTESEEPFEQVIDRIEDEETHAVLSAAVGQLDEVQRAVIVGYYFGGKTLKEIGESLGCPPNRVWKIRSTALKRLRYMPEVVMLRKSQHIERSLHRTDTCSPEYITAQRKVSEIIARGEYLSYGQKQAIMYECMRSTMPQNEHSAPL